jgi:hypothetical protein
MVIIIARKKAYHNNLISQIFFQFILNRREVEQPRAVGGGKTNFCTMNFIVVPSDEEFFYLKGDLKP